MIHALIAAGASVVLLLLGAPPLSHFYVPAFFCGREHTQAEYRYIEANGGKRADCSAFCGFFPSAWDLKSLLDWILPLIVGGVAALVQALGLIAA